MFFNHKDMKIKKFNYHAGLYSLLSGKKEEYGECLKIRLVRLGDVFISDSYIDSKFQMFAICIFF